MFPSIRSLLWLLAAGLCLPQTIARADAPSKRLIHQYGNGAWIESLAIRADGTILATQASAPNLFAINPSTGSSTLVRKFPNALGLVGITETTPDVFYVVAGNFSLANFTGTVGSFSLWKVDYSVSYGSRPAISKFLDLPDPKFLDGLTTVGADRQLLLGADLNKGNVIRIDLTKKTTSVVSNDPLMAPGDGIGVDGLKVRQGALYFTNPGKNLIGKLPIDTQGNPRGPATVVQAIGGDDFTFDKQGNIFTVGGSNNLTKIFGPRLARMQNLTMLDGPTAAQFGRTSKHAGCLYITTCGGDSAYAQTPVVVAGAIYGVDVFQNGSCLQ